MPQGVHLVGIEVESHLHAHGELSEERLVVGGVEQQVVGGQLLVALRAAPIGRAAPVVHLPQQQAEAVAVAESLAVPCGEGGMVKAGGLATLGVDYYKLGFQAGEMAADILSGKSKPADMAIQAQKEFKAMVNLKEAEKIGLKVPEDVLKGAELVK